MKKIQIPQFIVKEIQRIVAGWLKMMLISLKPITMREGLALLIVVPFVIAYVGFTLKALFIVTTYTELSQIAQTLLFPVFTLISLILGYYFKKDRDRDGGSEA